MKKTKSSIHCRSIVLVLFVVSWACWVSLETEAKPGKVLASRNDINGADSSEWFEPVEDAKNRSSTIQQQDPTHHQRQHRRRQPHRGTNVGSSSTRLNSAQEPDGAIYVASMNSCNNQPYAKVGSTTRYDNDCSARIAELQTGNPHELECAGTFLVTDDLYGVERKVHEVLEEEGLNIHSDCRGGTEWFSFPGAGVDSLTERVREILEDEDVLARDWVESSINPSLSPNQAQQFVYNSKWRQVSCKGDKLQHIAYNCK